MADRIEPLLREAALANGRIERGELTPEAGREFLGSFAAEALGTPGHLVDSGKQWLESAVQPDESPGLVEYGDDFKVLSHDEIDERGNPMTPPSLQDLAVADRARRDQAKADVAKYETLMKAEPGSSEWRQYWQSQHAQRAYRDALTIASGATLDQPGELPAAGEDVRAAITGEGAAPPTA